VTGPVRPATTGQRSATTGHRSASARSTGQKETFTAGGYKSKKGTACHDCGAEGHWAKECPEPSRPPVAGDERVQRPVSEQPGGKSVHAAKQEGVQKDVYLPVVTQGRKVLALLDTGCDRSLIGRRVLPPGFPVTPSKGRLFAANKTEKLLHGEVEFPFHVGERQFSAVVSVTDVVDE